MNLLQGSHRLSPQRFEAIREVGGQVTVAHQQRREPTLWNERVIEREEDDLSVHDMEWMPELAGVADGG